MSLWGDLEKLKRCRWVDLTHPLTNESPYWGGIPDGSVDLCKTVFDYDEEMLSCRIHTYKFPGQFGTHVDFPMHFVPGRPAAEEYGVEQSAYPLCVIDISGKVAENPDYAVTIDDVLAYEEEYGRIPEGRLSPCAPTGTSAGLATMRSNLTKKVASIVLMVHRNAEVPVRGARRCNDGHETFDTDARIWPLTDDLAVERYVLDTCHLQVEVMANLDKVLCGRNRFCSVARIEARRSARPRGLCGNKARRLIRGRPACPDARFVPAVVRCDA
ncbi:MAG: cyclase family protein [Slackia sp.]